MSGEGNNLTYDALLEIFESIYSDFLSRGYFHEAFGAPCVDGDGIGKCGSNMEGYVLRKLRKTGIWPIGEKYKKYTEADLFDVIEFLHEHISKPLKEGAHYHSWSDCGWHYTQFDKDIGEKEFVDEVNQFLNDYGDGYELSSKGEILSLGNPEFRPMLEAVIPTGDEENIAAKMRMAIDKFRKYGSTLDERSEAVRMLADCLEYLREDIKKVLNSKDEGDLFNIANNFAIRHHNPNQKGNYDKNIWLSWMFYFYLATIHAAIRLINKAKLD